MSLSSAGEEWNDFRSHFKKQLRYLLSKSGFVIPFSYTRNQGSLDKELILGWGQETHKTIPEHPTVPEIKEVLKNKKHPTTMGVCQGTQETTESMSQGTN